MASVSTPDQQHHHLHGLMRVTTDSVSILNGQDPPALEAPVQAPLQHRPFLWTEDPRLGPADVGVMATGTRGSHQPHWAGSAELGSGH